jgi:hypothetical protein
MKGIYQLTFPNDPHLRIYTGRSSNVEKRFEQHTSELVLGIHHNCKMQAYYNLYRELPEQKFIEGSYNTSRNEQHVQNSVERRRQWNVCPLVDNPKFKKKKRKKR